VGIAAHAFDSEPILNLTMNIIRFAICEQKVFSLLCTKDSQPFILFTFCNMLQASKQVTEGTTNNNQTNDIAAQETRMTPKSIEYEDYCVTKV
jgi:hypothetical protein